MLPHDWYNYRLTDRWCMEAGDASGIGLLDLPSRTLDPSMLQLVSEACLSLYLALRHGLRLTSAWCAQDLPNKMPESLVDPNAPIGKLSAEMASTLGLSEEVIVAPGSGDNMCAAMGTGCVTPGKLTVSLGTSGTLFGFSDKAIRDPSGTIAPFCDATGGWLPLLCTQNCTTVPQEVCLASGLVRQHLRPRAQQRRYGTTNLISLSALCLQQGHSVLTELAGQQNAGCDGCNFLPYLTGARTPNWPHSSGALLG
mmetsp:Transcript_12514/g.45638  ORF Transcript_12514/g.45638 Transcript_12514/m.45638 type:complete len:254 (+) Transcript_12514:190-951(+)